MDTHEMMANWDAWAKSDPMWAILTDPNKKGGRWNLEDFFHSGQAFVNDRIAWLQQQGIAFPSNAKALDFGCGLGRLTQALGRHFTETHGVDISEEMIKQARQLNRMAERVIYHHNPHHNLQLFANATFDLIISFIVLQHIPCRFQKAYLTDFLRVLKPGGVALFQCVHALGWRAWVPDEWVDLWRRHRSGGAPIIPMYGLPKQALTKICTLHGGVILHHQAHHSKKVPRFTSVEYLIRKEQKGTLGSN